MESARIEDDWRPIALISSSKAAMSSSISRGTTLSSAFRVASTTSERESTSLRLSDVTDTESSTGIGATFTLFPFTEGVKVGGILRDTGLERAVCGRSITSLLIIALSDRAGLLSPAAKPLIPDPYGAEKDEAEVIELAWTEDVVVAGLKTARAKSFNVEGTIAMVPTGGAVETGATEEFGVVPNIAQNVDGVVYAGLRGMLAGVGTSDGERKAVLTAKPMIKDSNATLVVYEQARQSETKGLDIQRYGMNGLQLLQPSRYLLEMRL